LEAAGFTCQLCDSKDKLQVHHRRYDNIGHESLSDLIVLCDRCHSRFHDVLKSDQMSLYRRLEIPPSLLGRIEDLLERQRKGQDRFDSYDTDKADVELELAKLDIRISIKQSGGE
jgi:HNH endonuclease